MNLRQTHTFAELEVPAELYDLVARKLLEASYRHCFEVDAFHGRHDVTRERVLDGIGADVGPIDMHGIALTRGASGFSRVALLELAQQARLPLRFVNEAERQCGTQAERVAFLRGAVEATKVGAPPRSNADGSTAPAARLLDDPILGRGKWDSVRAALGKDGEGLTDDAIDKIVAGLAAEPERPPVCPSGFAACELNRGGDAGLRRAASGNDAGPDNRHEQRGADQIPGFSGDERRDRAPSVGGAEQIKVLDSMSEETVALLGRVFAAKAPASPAPAAQDVLPSINFGDDLRR